jgi:hypothetical protein
MPVASFHTTLDGEDSTFLAGEWLKIYEGENKAGNGTTNNYIRSGLSAWASGTVYRFGNRVTHAGGVWECLLPVMSGITPGLWNCHSYWHY